MEGKKSLKVLVGEKSLDVWEETLNTQSPETKRLYFLAMDKFFKFHNLASLEDLFEIHNINLKSEDPRDRNKVSRMVNSCVENLITNDGLSASHASQVQKAVTSFLRANGFNDFRVVRVKSKNQTIEYNGSVKAKHEGIKKLLDLSGSLRAKSLIFYGKDSGLRVSDIVKLDYGDLNDCIAISKKGEFEVIKDFKLIELKQFKTQRVAKPCVGIETLNAIKDLLNERLKRGERIEKGTPIFIDIESETYGERLSSHNATEIVRRLVKKAGLKKTSIHSLRKFHQTYLEKEMPETWVAALQGRIIKDSRKAYSLPDDDELLESYIEAYPAIVVNGHQDIKGINDLKKSVNDLQAQLKQKDELIKELQQSSSEEKIDEKINSALEKLFGTILPRQRAELEVKKTKGRIDIQVKGSQINESNKA